MREEQRPPRIVASSGVQWVEAHRTAVDLTMLEHIFEYMKRVLVEIDDQTAAELERVAPARCRQRWDEEERRTREAYLDTPDDHEAIRRARRLGRTC